MDVRGRTHAAPQGAFHQAVLARRVLPGERERADGDVFRTIRSNPAATFGFVLDAVGRPAQPGTSTPGEAAARAKLVNALSRVTAPGLRDRELRSFCDWIPIVAEFSRCS